MADLSGDPPPSADGSAGAQANESAWPFWRTVLITLGVALGIRHVLVEARYIPSGSMLPGLQIQDRLLVEKLSYRTRLPRRGEIVVFHAPHAFDPVLSGGRRVSALECLPSNIPLVNKIPGFSNPACDAFIKRVVALPGERISVDPTGRVTINGQPLREPYVTRFCPTTAAASAAARPSMSWCRRPMWWCWATTAPTAGMAASGLVVHFFPMSRSLDGRSGACFRLIVPDSSEPR